MTFLECLDNEIFESPKTIGDEGIGKYLKTTFEKYKDVLDLISDTTLAREINKQKVNINDFCQGILNSLGGYQKGHIEQAYSDFKKAMDIFKPFLFPENKGQEAHTIGLYKPFYRARVGSNKPYTKEQMFHLQFSSRSEIK